MTHLTMEQLVALREPGREPGVEAWGAHLDGCPSCQRELERLHQRIARLRALPALQPAQDRWPQVRGRLFAERRARKRRWAGAAALAFAASVALVVVVGDLSRPVTADASTAISETMRHSQALEQAIGAYNPDSRVMTGRTARIAGALEDRIADLDRQLETAQLLDAASRPAALLPLWRERVSLLDALVDVHLTLANDVGL